MPKCVIDILIVEPFTWHSVVSLFNCPRHPLPESLVYALQKKKKNERQHYFLQKLTSRLKQGASYQYYKTRRCCQSVSQVSDVCQVSVHFPVPLTSHPLKKSRSSPSCHFHPVGWSGEADMAVLSSSRAAMEMGREKNEAPRLKDAALSASVVVVSQANRGY